MRISLLLITLLTSTLVLASESISKKEKEATLLAKKISENLRINAELFQKLEKMNAEIPDNVIVLRELAMIEMKTNRFEAAEAHFTRMIDLNSAAGSPDFNLFATRGWIRVFSFGKESLATQDLEVAEQHFDEISKANQERTLQGLANLSPLRNLVKTKAYAQRAVDLFQSSWAQQLLSLIEKYEEEQKKPLNRK